MNLAGPVANRIQFHLMDSFQTDFYHEPYFEYDFNPKLLKMRFMNFKDQFPQKFIDNSVLQQQSFVDEFYTIEKLNKEWKAYLDANRYAQARYSFPNTTPQNKGKLLVSFKEDENSQDNFSKVGLLKDDIPLNTLILKHDDEQFIRVYPGSNDLFHSLEEGYYKLIFFYSGARYQIQDSILVKTNGINYYEFEEPQIFKKDSFSVFVSDLIEEKIFEPAPLIEEITEETQQIYNKFRQQYTYTGEGFTASGYVIGAEDNMPLPGVSVLVKGTTYGTVTDINGYYSIKISSGKNLLQFSYIGYMSEELQPIDGGMDVKLTADVEQLEEIVVVGYGVQKSKQSLGYSVSAASTNALAIYGAKGDIVDSLTGRVAGISIEEDKFGKDVLHFLCDECELENKNNIIK